MSQRFLRTIAYCSFLLLLTGCDGDFVWVDNQKIVLCSTLFAIMIMCLGCFYGIIHKKNKE